MQPAPRLRDAKLEADLERDGYALVRRLLAPAEVERLLEAFRSHQAPIHLRPVAASIFSEDTAFRAALDRDIKAVLGPKVETILNGYRYSFANFLSKAPQRNDAAGEVPLHQDISFVDESRYQTLGLWCPLVDVDTTNGCLLVAPGSHRLNRGPRGAGGAFPYRAIAPLVASKLRPVPMAAGDALIYCQKLFHASHRTALARRASWRAGFACRATRSCTATMPLRRRPTASRSSRSMICFTRTTSTERARRACGASM